MFAEDLYKQLESYLKKIEFETSRPIKIIESRDLGIKGMLSAYRYDPELIVVIIKAGVPRFEMDMLRSIAHEATHGYLIFKGGYCRPEFHENVGDHLIKVVRLLFTMLDDIVVNKIIQDNGFPPFGSEYIPSVIRETRAALNQENIYENFSSDKIFDQILMITRLVLAWAFLEYFKLDYSQEQPLKNFINAYKNNFPQEYQLALKIIQIISKHNIFNSRGHSKAIMEILNLWGWGGILELRCHHQPPTQ